MDLLKAIEGEGAADYVVVDLGSGENWLTTRLFVLAVLLRRMRSLRTFVFVETRDGIDGRYLGVRSPEAIRWLLAREYSWLEAAFATAYAQIPNFEIRSESGALEPFVAGTVVEQFLRDPRIQMPIPPPNDEWVRVSSGSTEHARWINRALLERLFNVSPLRSSVEDDETLTSTERTAAILACEGPFVAIVDRDRRFKTLVDREALLERTARLVSSPQNRT
jgi:hypothetical protein